MRASRSASSSQLVAARTTSSRAGMPSGKTDLSRASRLRPFEPAARLLAPVEPRVPADALAVFAERELLARFAARVDCPASLCARLRCAPSAAARPNVRPQSGQTNSPEAGLAAALPPVVARLVV